MCVSVFRFVVLAKLTIRILVNPGQCLQMVLYLEACHSGSMLDQLSDSNGSYHISLLKSHSPDTFRNVLLACLKGFYPFVSVYAVSSCSPDEYTYACFFDKKRNTFLSDIFTFNWLQHMDTVSVYGVISGINSLIKCFLHHKGVL